MSFVSPLPGGSPQRVLIYSHDTFGLGHLRRARAIAHALVAEAPERRVVILSGSPVSHAFRFAPGVSCRRLPGVTKLASGEFQSLGPATGLGEVVAARAALNPPRRRTLRSRPLPRRQGAGGLPRRGAAGVHRLKARGCRLVLGCATSSTIRICWTEWERKGVLPVLPLYDVALGSTGCGRSTPPRRAGLRGGVTERLTYTGYLRREAPEPGLPDEAAEEPFLLVTPGGGGDGVELVEAVVRAYEAHALAHRALIVFGPFFRLPSRRRCAPASPPIRVSPPWISTRGWNG